MLNKYRREVPSGSGLVTTGLRPRAELIDKNSGFMSPKVGSCLLAHLHEVGNPTSCQHGSSGEPAEPFPRGMARQLSLQILALLCIAGAACGDSGGETAEENDLGGGATILQSGGSRVPSGSSTGTTAGTGTRENGATCSGNGDCASGICGENNVGEKRCYGTGEANDVCGDTYDCYLGQCLEPIPGRSAGACVPGIDVCYEQSVSGPCIEYVVALCQLIQVCDSNVSSAVPPNLFNFDYCIGNGCSYARDGVNDMTPTECAQAVNSMNSGTFGCP